MGADKAVTGRRLRLAAGMAVMLALAFGVLMAVLWRYESPRVVFEGLPAGCVGALEVLRMDAAASGARCDIRQWYLDQVAGIAALDDELARAGVGLDQRARCAYSIRHEARMEARARMPSRLVMTLLRLRDLLTYGHPDGPSLESLLDEERSAASYQRVIETAGATNERVDRSCELQPATPP